MSTASVSVSRPAVNPSEYHIGLPVRAKTADHFNGKCGTVAKIVHSKQAPAFYVRLDAPEYSHDLLYFAGNELEAIQ